MGSICKLSFVGLCSLLLLCGCDSGPDVSGIVAENNKAGIQKLANILMLYQARNGKAAANEDELCDFVANNDTIANNLKFMDINKSKFKDYLVSERDGQPFFVRYGIVVPDRTPPQALVFETIGFEGTRQVGWSDSTVQDVTDDNEYAKLKKGERKKRRVKLVDASAAASKAAAEAAEAGGGTAEANE